MSNGIEILVFFFVLCLCMMMAGKKKRRLKKEELEARNDYKLQCVCKSISKRIGGNYYISDSFSIWFNGYDETYIDGWIFSLDYVNLKIKFFDNWDIESIEYKNRKINPDCVNHDILSEMIKLDKQITPEFILENFSCNSNL